MRVMQSSLLADTTLTFAQKVLGTLCKLGFIILVARYLGVKASGEVAVAMLFVLAAGRIFGLGLDQSNTYHISHKKILTQNIIVYSVTIIAVTSVVAILICNALIGLNLHLFADVDENLLYLALFFYPFQSATHYLNSIFRGRYEIRWLNFLYLMPSLSRLIMCLCLIAVDAFSTTTAIWSWGLSLVITCSIGGLVVARSCFIEWTLLKIKSREISQWFSYGIRYYLDTVFYLLTLRSDIFLVNYFLGSAAAGIYSIGLQICDRVLLLPNSLSTVLFPRLGHLDHSDESKQRYVIAIASATFYIAAGLVTILTLFAEPIILLLFGAEFLPAAKVLWFLLPGVVAYSVTRTFSTFLASIGRPGLNSIRESICFLVNLALNLLLIPKLGIIGAALATSTAYLLSLVISLFLHRNLTGFNPWIKIVFNQDLLALSLKNVRRYMNI